MTKEWLFGGGIDENPGFAGITGIPPRWPPEPSLANPDAHGRTRKLGFFGRGCPLADYKL